MCVCVVFFCSGREALFVFSLVALDFSLGRRASLLVYGGHEERTEELVRTRSARKRDRKKPRKKERKKERD